MNTESRELVVERPLEEHSVDRVLPRRILVVERITAAIRGGSVAVTEAACDCLGRAVNVVVAAAPGDTIAVGATGHGRVHVHAAVAVDVAVHAVKAVVVFIAINAVSPAEVDLGEPSPIDVGLGSRLRGGAVWANAVSVRAACENIGRVGVSCAVDDAVHCDVANVAQWQRSLHLRVHGARASDCGLLLVGAAGNTGRWQHNTAIVANLRCEPAAA